MRCSRTIVCVVIVVTISSANQAVAQPPVLSLDPSASLPDLMHRARVVKSLAGQVLEFTNPLQYAEVQLDRNLDGIEAMTVGGWFFPRRSGEQYFFSRGLPETGPFGERFFRPNPKWVNFVLGTDQHGFLLGTINGNGSMPFAHVTVNDVPINSWSQLVVAKDKAGFHKFYRNGTLVHTDRDSAWAGKIIPFVDGEGEPVRLAMPLGGLVGEAWVYPRELTEGEIKKDFDLKKVRYKPALAAEPVALRAMHQHPTDAWHQRGGLLTKDNWPKHRDRILAGVNQILGPMPKEKVPLDPKILSDEDCGTYIRRKVSIQVLTEDRMPAYLLIPKKRQGRLPAIICFYGTTSGAGKDVVVGLSGNRPGTPPVRNWSFALDIVEAGFVALAADYLRDGERLPPSKRPYDTSDFYARFPDWSIHGKDAWDTMRAIDYLQTLDFVDPDRIGMVGHSYGGHSTIFTTALEPRIKAAWANGPVSDFIHHGMHWAVPKGAGSSQSMPALRPFVLDPTLKVPVTFAEFTALTAPRPLTVSQAVGERRPMEEENAATVSEVYRVLGAADRVQYLWYAGDHDFPPVARKAAVKWFEKWLSAP
jgi:dienelactone hydrolase